MRRPSILFLNRVYPPRRGATGRILRELARSFAREGWQVTVITSGPKAEKIRDGGVRVITVKGPEKPATALGYIFVWFKMLWAALRLPKTHLLVTMSDPPFLVLAGQMIKKFKGARHVHWCQDLYPDILPALDVRLPAFIMSMFKGFVQKAMLRADKVIVIGRCMAKHLTYDGIDPKAITMIPNWPDFELMQMGKVANQNKALHQVQAEDVSGYKPYDEQLKAGPKFRILYAGNLGRAHPIETILGAAEILNTQHPEIEFVFVGDGPKFDEIARQRSQKRLDNIRLLPYQPSSRLREVMEAGDVHLISIKEEAAGMLVPCKLYSALAVQRPCIFIGPAGSEAAKVISDFNAGAVIAQGAHEELAEEIKRFRLSGEDWFAAQAGAGAAGEVFVPKDAINSWIERAWSVVKEDIQEAA